MDYVVIPKKRGGALDEAERFLTEMRTATVTQTTESFLNVSLQAGDLQNVQATLGRLGAEIHQYQEPELMDPIPFSRSMPRNNR